LLIFIWIKINKIFFFIYPFCGLKYFFVNFYMDLYFLKLIFLNN
jgi:hypothetical protein